MYAGKNMVLGFNDGLDFFIHAGSLKKFNGTLAESATLSVCDPVFTAPSGRAFILSFVSILRFR